MATKAGLQEAQNKKTLNLAASVFLNY